MMISNYDKNPSIEVSKSNSDGTTGWTNVCAAINNHLSTIDKGKVIVAIDTYHGVNHNEVIDALSCGINCTVFYKSTDAFKSEEQIAEMVYPDVTDDRVFGFMTRLTIEDYFDAEKLAVLQQAIEEVATGVVVVYGEGAAYVAQQWDTLIYLDMARWEIQLRMRRHEVNNLGVSNRDLEFPLLYKQAFFVDWRVLDRHKVAIMQECDFFMDTTKPDNPKLIKGEALLRGLQLAVKRPFRVVPFFDPGPWGGQWLKEVADLDRSAVNYAWAFDCVPEENSLLLKLGDITFETPSINVVFYQPEALLGDEVYKRFGAEFPIRFDFLDTMDGGNLSLQVHPTVQYIRDKFGMTYTQDESYYILDAKENACVYLGLNEDVKPQEMISELREAQNNGQVFEAEKYVQIWPVKKHDHVLIPAGTVHCSGKDSVVLEISATPYIFTFKLWDWERVGLDGKPRPININHGEKVIQWDRRSSWVEQNLLDRVEKVAEGDGWVEERTGLHETQFIETRRHWFTKKVLHHTHGGVNVLNLIEGEEAVVESPMAAFEPFVVHYAETFIVPAAVGDYTIRPHGPSEGKECATIKAFVRTKGKINGYHFR